MTPVSIGLVLLGLIGLFWPLATLLHKRHVLNAQWLMMLALTMVSFTFILLGCLFNTFLMREYLLLMLLLDVILATPPVIHIAINALTRQNNASLSVRTIFLPTLICIGLMIASSMIGGAEMYRQWADRCCEGYPSVFVPGAWRYNLIVVANFYIFWLVFTFETLYIFVSGIRKAISLRKINAEYYSDERFRNLNLKGIYIASNLGLALIFATIFTQPFSPDHPLLFYLTYVLPFAAILFYIGHSVYAINTGAEHLPRHTPTHRDPAALVRRLDQYVEKEHAFLNPDLSVPALAKALGSTEDEIIDAIHHSHGVPFAEYLDALRVQHAVTLILAEHSDLHNPDVLAHLAHQTGFLTPDALESAWQRVLHAPLGQSFHLD